MNWKLTSTTKTYTCTFMVTLFIITKFESHKIVFWYQFSSVQSLSCVWLFATLCTVACQASLSFTISLSLLKLMSIESVMLSNHLILCHSLLLLPSIFPSIRVLSSELALHSWWSKYWSFSFRIILPVNIQSEFHWGLTGLISVQSKGLSRVFSSTTVQKPHFFSAEPSLCSKSHICT